MKQTHLTGMIMILFFSMTTTATAVDISALDRVSVMMPKEKVLSILGPPGETGKLSMGLTAEIYKVTGAPGSDAESMLGAGCVYDTNLVLKGLAFMFDGRVARKSAEHMKAIGFTLIEEKEQSFRLTGKDDDTGLPIVVDIFEQEGMTTIMTLEKGFYEQMVK